MLKTCFNQRIDLSNCVSWRPTTFPIITLAITSIIISEALRFNIHYQVYFDFRQVEPEIQFVSLISAIAYTGAPAHLQADKYIHAYIHILYKPIHDMDSGLFPGVKFIYPLFSTIL